ncbi:MAG: clostripain-related cysteine peptidase [Candidatus Sericytochromatia bacterium]
MNKKVKLQSFFIASLLLISACSNNDNINNLDIAQSEILQNNNKVNVPEDKNILPQIKSNTIEQTEWGTKVKALPIIKETKKASVLSYMGFDNDKGDFGGTYDRDELRKIINFHELSGSSSVMNMILQTDGVEKADLKRYMIIKDEDANKMVSPYTSFKYERNSADYRVLGAFVKWGFSTYPSQIKMLDIDSHGGAFVGITKDRTSKTTINLPNLSKALKSSGFKLDILNFDACLMGAMEVVYELKDNADIIIGSQDSTLTTGMLYTKALPSIIAGSKTAEEISRKIVLASDIKGNKDFIYDDFSKQVNQQGKTPNVFTIASYRTSKLENLAKELDKLAKMIINKLPQQKQAIKVAFDGTHAPRLAQEEVEGQRDLYEILSRIEFTNYDQEIKAQVKETREALNKVIVIARINQHEVAQGMAINISPNSVSSDLYKATAFAKNTSWDEMVLAVNK